MGKSKSRQHYDGLGPKQGKNESIGGRSEPVRVAEPERHWRPRFCPLLAVVQHGVHGNPKAQPFRRYRSVLSFGVLPTRRGFRTRLNFLAPLSESRDKRDMVKAVVVLYAAIAFASVAAQGQGQFLFDTHDWAVGNDVRFYYDPSLHQGLSGPDYFVQVLAGPDWNNLEPLTPLLTLNRTGIDAGYTDPFALTYTVPDVPAGTDAFVAFRAFWGPSWEGAYGTTMLRHALMPVKLGDSESAPPEVSLGTIRVALVFPEPSTWAMMLIGLGAIVLASRRTNGCTEPDDSTLVPGQTSVCRVGDPDRSALASSTEKLVE
jgi:hypothetical protein